MHPILQRVRLRPFLPVDIEKEVTTICERKAAMKAAMEAAMEAKRKPKDSEKFHC